MALILYVVIKLFSAFYFIWMYTERHACEITKSIRVHTVWSSWWFRSTSIEQSTCYHAAKSDARPGFESYSGRITDV